MTVYNFESVCENLLKLCKKLGRIPTKTEINNYPYLPSDSGLRYIFKTKSDMNYSDFCKNNGYDKFKYNSHTYNSLMDVWYKFYGEYNRFPKSKDYGKDGVPSYRTILNVLGDRKEEFFRHFESVKDVLFRDKYNKECDEFKDYCLKNNRIPTIREIKKLGFPDSRWFVMHSQNKNVNTYPEFIESLGLKPNTLISKETAIRTIQNKTDKLERNLTYDDFINPKFNEIGIQVINRIWGTFNNMMIDLGFEINQESMIDKVRTLKELKDDILNACQHIEESEGRKNISLEDIDNLDWCLSSQTYHRYFKNNLGVSLAAYIQSLGYIPNKVGMGMIYEFEDGEVTKSKFEYDVSNYLMENNYTYNESYFRNVRYKEFINGYTGNKDCDYVVKTNSQIWYIEIAGMLEYKNINEDDYIKQKYKKHLNEKEQMLKLNDINYKIIYPNDLKTKPLYEVFSFLQ